MNLEQLECIMAVAKCGSFTRAAKMRMMTVAGVSRSVSLLEEEIKVRIFIRSHNGVALTPEGEKILQKATMIINGVEELRQEAQSYNQLNNTKIRIGTIPETIALLVEVLTQLKKEFPILQIEITESGPAELMQEMTENNLDAAYVILSDTDAHLKNTEYSFEKIMEGNLIVGVSKFSPLASKQSVSMADLIDYSFALYNDKYISELVAHFEKTVNVLFTTNNVAAIQQAVREEIAVTIATNLPLKGLPGLKDCADLTTIPLVESIKQTRNLYAVRKTNNTNQQALNIFLNRVKQSSLN